MRDKVVDLIIGQISLLFACVDQLFYVVVLVIKCQTDYPRDVRRFANAIVSSAVGVGTELRARRTNFKSIARHHVFVPPPLEVCASPSIALSRPYLFSR